MERQLTRREKRELKRQRRTNELRHMERRSKAKRVFAVVVAVLVVGGGIAWLIWFVAKQPPVTEADVISRTGLHWHPELAIYLKGVKQEISTDIGIGLIHEPFHTHDATGVIHMEMSGLVKKEDTTLGQFFKIWGKDFNTMCIFEHCNGPEGTVRMLVNGEESMEFENYLMKDKDRIEIRYE